MCWNNLRFRFQLVLGRVGAKMKKIIETTPKGKTWGLDINLSFMSHRLTWQHETLWVRGCYRLVKQQNYRYNIWLMSLGIKSRDTKQKGGSNSWKFWLATKNLSMSSSVVRIIHLWGVNGCEKCLCCLVRRATWSPCRNMLEDLVKF